MGFNRYSIDANRKKLNKIDLAAIIRVSPADCKSCNPKDTFRFLLLKSYYIRLSKETPQEVIMEITQRLLNYVAFNTQSEENSTMSPSTEQQWPFARYLEQELTALGAEEITVTPACYVFATIPATTSIPCPTIGFIAHMDTSPAVSGGPVHPQQILFDGKDILLNPEKNIWLRATDYPDLALYKGDTLIVTDGTTLLGADDKAGIAEIMTMAEYLLQHPELPNGKLRLGFTPDEEVGRGTEHFDIQAFGADFAYTCDGDCLGAVEYENFNAASAEVRINGVSIHPGSARGKMQNAILMAMEFHALLPVFANPACTDGYEGFYHLEACNGRVEETILNYIIRDHDKEKFTTKKNLLEAAANFFRQKYGEKAVQLTIKDSYFNMRQYIALHPELIENACQAFRSLDIPPRIQAIRGGTDGAQLSSHGLPCPNLGIGGGNFHSRFEFVSIPAMEKTVQALIRLAQSFVPQDHEK